jgi:hypothetical protein
VIEISEMAKKDCTTCIYYDVVLGIKAVCMLWLVGFDKRGYELCEEYKEVGKSFMNSCDRCVYDPDICSHHPCKGKG